MSLRLPARVSSVLVTVVLAGSTAGGGWLMYQRHVVGHPMKIFRDSEGVLRFQTRRDALEEGARKAHDALTKEPESRQKQFDAWLADKLLKEELDKQAAAHGADSIKPLSNEDLT
jgi:hypothetical protein